MSRGPIPAGMLEVRIGLARDGSASHLGEQVRSRGRGIETGCPRFLALGACVRRPASEAGVLAPALPPRGLSLASFAWAFPLSG